jgi:prepilin signal peptidase PulO-like enzyme (type II secretory pathway)
MACVLVFTAFSFAIGLTDIKTYRIPDVLLLLFLTAMQIFNFGHDVFYYADRTVSAAVYFFLFYLIFRYSGGLGFGDVKYAAALGYMLGVKKMLLALFLTSFIALVFYSICIFIFRWDKHAKVPFAPFLGLGSTAAMFRAFAGMIDEKIF